MRWVHSPPPHLHLTSTHLAPQLLNVVYGYDHGAAASMGGVAQGGSVIGLLYVGNVLYKSRDRAGKVPPAWGQRAVLAAPQLARLLWPPVAGPPGPWPHCALGSSRPAAPPPRVQGPMRELRRGRSRRLHCARSAL